MYPPHSSQTGLSKVSCQWHLTPVLQTLGCLVLTTRLEPPLLITAYKARPVLNLVSFNSSLCSNHTGLFSFKYAKLVSILSFGSYCAFCLECSSPRSLHGCLLLDIQISTEMSLLTDVFPPVLAEEMPPTPFFLSHCPILFSLYLLSLSVIFFIFPHHKCFTYYVFNFYKVILVFLKCKLLENRDFVLLFHLSVSKA